METKIVVQECLLSAEVDPSIEETCKIMESDLHLAKGNENSTVAEEPPSSPGRYREKWVNYLTNNNESPAFVHSSFPPQLDTSKPKFTPPENWANAPEFVPKCFRCETSEQSPSRSYAQVAFLETDSVTPSTSSGSGSSGLGATAAGSYPSDLCPFYTVGQCRYGVQCMMVHGLVCDFCGHACLHPNNPDQREQHYRECVQQHEKDMELSFAVARSSDKTCGVCMETIMDKSPPGEQRFGILPSCNHCFCLSCIRKWRQARQFENKIIRACPECRITSDFVCPSRYWVENKEDKDKLISSYKVAMSKKPCRYYRSGSGQCPFGNKCFYLHALPNGTKVDVGPPRRRPRVREGASGAQGLSPVSIWEFLEEWEMQWLDIEDFMDTFDSDETSSWSAVDDDQDSISDSEPDDSLRPYIRFAF